MTPNIQWITPMYGFGADCTHVGVPEIARPILKEMASELIGTSGLIAVYIPEGTEEIYEPGGMRGRVVGAVRLVKMPRRKKVEDYYYDDWDGSRRWPIGWPCKVIYAPDEDECPFFRDHIEHLFGPDSFGSYVSRFQLGPFRLEPVVQERLNSDFEQFEELGG